MPDSKQDKHFRDLLGRLLDDEPEPEALSAEEMAEFTTLVKTSPDYSLELRIQLLMDSRLAQYENIGHDASSFVAAVDAALDAEADGDAFVSKIVQLTDECPAPSSGIPWTVAATSLAACLASCGLAAGLLGGWRRGGAAWGASADPGDEDPTVGGSLAMCVCACGVISHN